MFSFACENDDIVDFVNQTEQAVEIRQGGELVFELDPGQTRGIVLFSKDWTPEITAISKDGTILLDETITWEQVEAMDHRIVITEPG